MAYTLLPTGRVSGRGGAEQQVYYDGMLWLSLAVVIESLSTACRSQRCQMMLDLSLDSSRSTTPNMTKSLRKKQEYTDKITITMAGKQSARCFRFRSHRRHQRSAPGSKWEAIVNLESQQPPV
ncbi:hypothetical protein EVAR_18888_1 [Eumeta japonica]|uniref:Uncharacterized protein n=1 Tax=Eumeta variegata TaxID=151549 RepID=A0A4C1V327_EUMVA|nr:hypothetical protein EVAR_18888_1 [Eumeta japonica]